MTHYRKFGALAGFAAAASMAITPAQAAEVEAPNGTMGIATATIASLGGNAGGGFITTYDTQADTANNYRGFRARRGFRRYRRGGIRGGDVLAGILVLGGIAAIASAASNNNRRRDRDVVVVERERQRDTQRHDDRRTNRSTSGGSGIDNAVSLCLNEIERDVRVDSVDGASRLAEGWVVSGTLFNGSGFTCQIGNDGRIAGIDYSGFASNLPAGSRSAAVEGQWSDDRYADARSAHGSQAYLAPDPQALPAYPGGPIPGQALPE